jgi:hypothetical protein
MSYENFKPTVWSSHIQHELPKFTVFKQDCNFEFEGEAGEGKKVKILGVARPTISKYVPGTDMAAAEKVQDTSVYLDIDQYDSFNYTIDNIDKAQATKGLMPALSEETTRALAEAEDTFCAEQIAKNAGSKSASTSLTTADNAKIAIDKLFVQLWKNGVSNKDKLTLYLTPWLYSLFEDKLITLKTDNDSLIADGILGMYRGARVKMSNNIYNDGTDDHIILKTSKGFAYCNGIDKMIPYCPDLRFEDAIKGLNTYGGKAVRPKEIAVLKAHNS